MAKKAPQSDLLTTTLLVFAVAGLGVSSVAASAGVASLAYDFQMSLPQVPTTSNVAAVASTGGSGLTDAQVSAVLTLLAAFGAPQDTVTSVGAILRGENSDGDVVSNTTTSANTVAVERPQVPLICPNFMRHLMRGAVGDDVAALQRFLSQQGMLSEDNVTGVFGSTTQLALQRWQLAQGIVSTTSPDSGAGEVGTRTREAIARLCAPSTSVGDTSGTIFASTTSTTLPAPTYVSPTPGWTDSTGLPTHVPPTPGWVGSTTLPTPAPPTPVWVGSTTPPSNGSGTSGTGSSDSFLGW